MNSKKNQKTGIVKNSLIAFAVLLGVGVFASVAAEEDPKSKKELRMDELWGEQVEKLRPENMKRGQLFNDGNYAMLICWGPYSKLACKYKGKTYYGISEWIMSKGMASIPVAEYKELAKEFNPVKYNALEIAQLASDAGMRYILAMPKHHDGFAMFKSATEDKFNIVDHTPFKRDPMKELSDACKKVGIGFGFYYSHNQDWTFPGGTRGPKVDGNGKKQTFDDYFEKKCKPQLIELTTKYGAIEVVWFDTPEGIPKKYAEEVVKIVRKNQPKALISARVGHGLGDYRGLGDMEVPNRNEKGMWESVDTVNDSWGYAWYDENWKTPKDILHRLISCVGRGGTYLLDIGPRGDGSIPHRKARSLRSAGAWIKKYPQVVYGTDASPFGHSLPWGDATVRGNSMFLSIFSWPTSGELYLPGLKTEVVSAQLLEGKKRSKLSFDTVGGWLRISKLPVKAPEKLVSVIKLELKEKPTADTTLGIDPEVETKLLTEFATVKNAKKSKPYWMEKYGEWKTAVIVDKWKKNGKATWEVTVAVPGEYQVGLTYMGVGRLVWKVGIEGGKSIQNQLNSSSVYHSYPMGWINFPKPGKYKVSVSCIEGNINRAVLRSITFTPIQF